MSKVPTHLYSQIVVNANHANEGLYPLGHHRPLYNQPPPPSLPGDAALNQPWPTATQGEGEWHVGRNAERGPPEENRVTFIISLGLTGLNLRTQ